MWFSPAVNLTGGLVISNFTFRKDPLRHIPEPVFVTQIPRSFPAACGCQQRRLSENWLDRVSKQQFGSRVRKIKPVLRWSKIERHLYNLTSFFSFTSDDLSINSMHTSPIVKRPSQTGSDRRDHRLGEEANSRAPSFSKAAKGGQHHHLKFQFTRYGMASILGAPNNELFS